MPTLLDYDQLVKALRMNLNQVWKNPNVDSWMEPASGKARGSLTALVNKGVEDLDNRIPVIVSLIDRPIESTSELTKWECSVLIEYLKVNGTWSLSDEGYYLVSTAEALLSTSRSTNEPDSDALQEFLSDLQLAGF